MASKKPTRHIITKPEEPALVPVLLFLTAVIILFGGIMINMLDSTETAVKNNNDVFERAKINCEGTNYSLLEHNNKENEFNVCPSQLNDRLRRIERAVGLPVKY